MSQSTTTNRSSLPARNMILVLATMFALAVPWWWSWLPDVGSQVLFGAPTWVVTAVLGSFLISCVTVVFLQQAWRVSDAAADDEQAGLASNSAEELNR